MAIPQTGSVTGRTYLYFVNSPARKF